MRELNISPWCIVSKDPENRSFRESIFSIGNGYMGTRGYRPDERGEHAAWRSTFLSGFYEYIQPSITDIVNQPDFSGLEIRLNGYNSSELTISDFVQSLDMRNGLLAWRYVLTDAQGNRTRVLMDKFLSMKNRHIAAIRLCLFPENWSGSVELSGGIDGAVENLPIADDQLTDNLVMVRMWENWQTRKLSGGGLLTATTVHSGRKIAEGYYLRGEGDSSTSTTEMGVFTTLEGYLRKGETWEAEKLIAVASYRDGDPQAIVEESLRNIQSRYFTELLAESGESWRALWRDADVQIKGNDELQGAIRYNIFQLLQATPHNDPHASIGARGLTHGRYKGCYFWDTEIFMLPFLVWTVPEESKNLLMYRYNTLPDARESARRFSTTGARYSWMSSDTGFEQCGSWDTGCCEIHITADVAYAIGYYCQITGDKTFLRDCGTEVFIETARYWVDRFNYSPREDLYHLLFVKGPDEYCGVTADDFYTVSMAKDNLELAIKSIRWMQKEYPDAWEVLRAKTGFDDREIAKWQEIYSKCFRIYDENTKLWKQDATFEYLQPLDIQMHKQDDVPLYHKIGFDRLQRYQVLKQPAVLMYMALRPELFSHEEMEAAWEYYEPKTLHDSTLSFGIHALLASRLNRSEEAMQYFEKAVFLDLKNVMSNTAKEGIHTASLGASLQALVLGFGGLIIEHDNLRVENRLPDSIDEMEYRIRFKDRRYKVRICKGTDPEIFLDTEPVQ